jgi:tetratricopeptide (TPR) repeat protein
VASTDVSASAPLPGGTGVPPGERPVGPPSRRLRRRWIWLLLGAILLGGGAWPACEGWAAWQERLARQALADDRVDEARSHVERALLVRRRRSSTLMLAARISRRRGEYSQAEQYLLRSGQLHGMSEPVQLEWLLLRCQRGEVDELAPNLLALVKQQHPETPAILETLARVYLRQTRYLEALRCLDRWLQLAPDSIRALDWRGWVCNQLDHREQAISDYQRLLELQPGRTDIRLRLAQILIDSARHAEAAAHLERLLGEMPDNPDVPAALAPCRVVQDRMEEAQALLDAVLKDHPEHFDALSQRGKLELTLGHPEQAEPWLRKALAVKPHDMEARYSLYRSLQGQSGRDQEADRELARWEDEGKKQSRLTRLLRTELAGDPNNVELAHEAGELFLDLDEEERGTFWLRRALDINPRHVRTRQALLAYYERTNQPDKAAEQRRQLQELNHETHE